MDFAEVSSAEKVLPLSFLYPHGLRREGEFAFDEESKTGLGSEGSLTSQNREIPSNEASLGGT